jgi:phenylacetate-CoA ligase
MVSISEKAPRREIRAKQLERFKRLMEYAYENSGLYRRGFDEVGVKPQDIKSLDEISQLPFLNEDMIREEVKKGDPYGGLLCCPEDMVQVISVPEPREDKAIPKGWRGFERIPWLFGYTRTDFDMMVAMLTRIWSDLGLGFKDKIQLINNWPDLWLNTVCTSIANTGANVYAGGMAVMAAAVNVTTARYLKPDFLCAPIYIANDMITRAESMGLNPEKIYSCYRKAIFNQGILTAQLSQRFNEKGFRGEHYNLYYVPEAGLFAIDCEEHNGLHIPEDFFIVEIIDEKGKPVREGEKGRLVVTNLIVEATPYIRYQTHDVATLSTEPCECGRKFARINLAEFQAV